MPTLRILFAGICLFPLDENVAQQRGALPPAAHVRYWLGENGKPVEADVVFHGADTIWVRLPPTADMLALRLSDLSRLEVRRGSGGHASLGAGIGTFVGAVTGSFVFEGGSRNPNVYQRDVARAYVFAALCGGVGALIGSTVRIHHWEDVPLRRQRPGQ